MIDGRSSRVESLRELGETLASRELGDRGRMPRVHPTPALKQQLGRELARLLAGWIADDIATLIGTDRPPISEARRGKLARFSLETLILYLARLHHRVDVSVTRARPAASRAVPHRARVRKRE